MTLNRPSTPPHDGPPAYNHLQVPTQQDELAFLDRVAATPSPDTRRYVHSPVAAAEATRLQTFLRFALSIDYQVDYHSTLPAPDRAHFANLYTTINDLGRTAINVVPTDAERAALAPYLWTHLHEPCSLLDLPVEIVIVYISRFYRFQGKVGLYKGSIEHIPVAESMRGLAAKFVTDRETMIPRVIADKAVREEFLRAVEQRSKFYFRELKGIDGKTVLKTQKVFRRAGSVSRTGWICEQTLVYEVNEMAFELNERGEKVLRAQQNLNQALAENHITKMYVWARSAVGRMLGRNDDIKCGKAPMDPIGVEGSQNVAHQSAHVPHMFADENRAHFTYG